MIIIMENPMTMHGSEVPVIEETSLMSGSSSSQSKEKWPPSSPQTASLQGVDGCDMMRNDDM